MAKDIKLKFSGTVELNQKILYAPKLSKERIYSVWRTAWILSWQFYGMLRGEGVELNQKIQYTSRFSKEWQQHPRKS